VTSQVSGRGLTHKFPQVIRSVALFPIWDQPWRRALGGTINMLWTIFVVLLVMWLLGFGFHVGGSLIHLLLVCAAIVLVWNLVTGRRSYS